MPSRIGRQHWISSDGLLALLASLKSRRTCSSRLTWWSSGRMFSDSPGSLASSAAMHNSLQFLRAPSALEHLLGLACREYCVAVLVTSAAKPRGILHFFVLTEALPRLTARKAATIEPTIQVPISAVTALNDNAPNNSTILSSIRTTSISGEACPQE